MNKPHKSKSMLNKLISLIFIYCIFIIVVDRSPYPEQTYQWYQQQRLEYNLRCEGDTEWLRKTSIELIKQESHDPLIGFSLAYISPNGTLSTCVSGWVHKFSELPQVTPTTAYQFASVSKTFVSDLILDLVRQDKLSLEDKLVDILPELQDISYNDPRVRNIRIRHLLEHRAGFDRAKIGVNDDMFEPQPWCPSHVEKLATISLQFNPDERMAYSNTGYCLLSRIAEEKYNQPYQNILKIRYHLNDFNNFDFVTDDIGLPSQHSAITKLNPDYNYEALASVAGLYGDAPSLALIVYNMEKSKSPNILTKPIESWCNTSVIKGCHGYMGYEYSPSPRLRFFWRDGSMSTVSALLVIDNKGGVMTMLTNVKRTSGQVPQLVKRIYELRLQE
ncbi:serine hydrolase [Psychrobacter arenosus]|uniref:serine hydrolase domain-containing protein n=1 Tax=Psychrobacter arenosus TaxID=256326 RepID=UPI00191840C4|nr:serine hydrolase domain-containing protein [Psychrobacter arenosus]